MSQPDWLSLVTDDDTKGTNNVIHALMHERSGKFMNGRQAATKCLLELLGE